MNVILIGYRAAGKTSVGRNLAGRLEYSFHDTDEMIVGNTGKTILELVTEGGWSLFREKERSAVTGLSRSDRCVIALGGGAVLDKENVERLRKKGLFIWLRADAGTIVNRMREDRNSGHQRPSLSGRGRDEEVHAVLRSREEVYKRVARFSVNTTDRSIEEVSEEILRRLENDYTEGRGTTAALGRRTKKPGGGALTPRKLVHGSRSHAKHGPEGERT